MSDAILKVKRLSLTFQADIYRSWTLRESFTRWLSDPASALVSESDRLQVARDLSFEVRRGDRIGLMGVNGTGKTSLCRCIAGMYRPTSGKIEVKGSVRAVFDTTLGIQPELTGRENAELLAHFMYPGAVDRKAIVEEALQFSELGRFVDAPYRIYSNGMQARLCLSIVSALPADLLILDEVFDGADAYFKTKVAARVRQLIERSGAVIFVSHTEENIADVCNRVIVLDRGSIAFDGPVSRGIEFYRRLTSPKRGKRKLRAA